MPLLIPGLEGSQHPELDLQLQELAVNQPAMARTSPFVEEAHIQPNRPADGPAEAPPPRQGKPCRRLKLEGISSSRLFERQLVQGIPHKPAHQSRTETANGVVNSDDSSSEHRLAQRLAAGIHHLEARASATYPSVEQVLFPVLDLLNQVGPVEPHGRQSARLIFQPAIDYRQASPS